ncbi:MAG: adenylyltransferase/cytidyltransferase family protein [Lentisphaerae bacterium]|nr:adenylyltransferase/cytidyltransferase family protein [Lentisphaerota bacterium]
MNTVLTYGTFDLFHIGHLRLLERARALGDRLIVAVSTDTFNEGKGKRTVIPYADRAAIVQALKIVDEVIPEESWEQKRDDIRRFNVTTFVMGDDWAGKFDDLKDACDVVYLPRTDGISTTELKQSMALLGQIIRELR